MKLSANFSLDEFLVSQTATRHDIDNTPGPQEIDNLRKLCEGVLQPLREAVDRPIWINSGYRSPQLNSLIGGSLTSAHMKGNAADIRVSGMEPYDVCNTIVNLKLPFDQVILEFPPNGWVHVGVADTLRGEQLTAYKKDGKTAYIHGIRKMEDL